MSKTERVYRRTETGEKAWQSQDPSLSEEHRQVLGLIHTDTHWDEIRKLLRRHADYQRLAELEAGGLIASELAAPGSDLDFTGSFAFR
jgi:hypothetical protein